ncbi:glycerophosphoryl diester phosphodiesterase [Kineococcus xinjiangensis]|uniref:glycerophosphodiester phosphodiesterase n=2 Tax=Kineococcus xinjiangensis TaxID=512762 RepID=A0A2S6ITV1_9ACTN|nr:glycerophosphoryl diester phosphodiesterase [Kineococcus xinjiangensis]
MPAGAAAGLLATALVAPSAAAAPGPQALLKPKAAVAQLEEPVVVAHRGASAYRPEHTIPAYELGARMGADWIEPDLVPTKDGVLVARHENEISGTTDVEERPEFAARKATKVVDGGEVTGWFTEDFTLAELKTLRAEERLPELRPRNTAFDGRYQVPTFEEVLQVRERLSEELGREIGIIPETKHSTYFASIGLPMEAEVARLLREYGLDDPDAPVAVQSFELTNLKELRTEHRLRADLVFLTWHEGAPYDLVAAGDERTYADLVIPSSLRDLSRYVDGIGPSLQMTFRFKADGSVGRPTNLIRNAHRAGLTVVPYTHRPENTFLPTDLRVGEDPEEHGRAVDWARAVFEAGADGLFSDAPDLADLARDDFMAEQERDAA